MRRPARGTESGTTMVEFTLVSFVFFALMFGIYEFATIYGDKVALEHAATDGARRAAQIRTAGTAVLDSSVAVTKVTQEIRDDVCQSYGNKLDCSKVGITITSTENLDMGPADGQAWGRDDYVQVEITYPWNFPIIHDLIGAFGTSVPGVTGGTFHATSKLIIE